MISYNRFLYDEIGNEYERKNLYLLEIADLNEKMEEADPESKRKLELQLKKLIETRKTHPYNIELNKYKKEEKVFLKTQEEAELLLEKLKTGFLKEGEEI